mmetsp:Transcript_88164/g.153166  ORF Transcript_88164/g.153166 Transcript_88164/m.153166 type:complete len:83 (+) Transcript_88164:520-768(+)
MALSPNGKVKGGHMYYMPKFLFLFWSIRCHISIHDEDVPSRANLCHLCKQPLALQQLDASSARSVQMITLNMPVGRCNPHTQ